MASRSDWSDAGLDGMLRRRASRQPSTRRLHDLFDPNRRRTPAQSASQVPTRAVAQADSQAAHLTSSHSTLETDTVMTDADEISPLSAEQQNAHQDVPQQQQTEQPEKVIYAADRYKQKKIPAVRPRYLKKTYRMVRPTAEEKDIYVSTATPSSSDESTLQSSSDVEDTASDHRLIFGLASRITGRPMSSAYQSTWFDNKPPQPKSSSENKKKSDDDEEEDGYNGHLDGIMPPLSSIDDIYEALAESIQKLPNAEAVFGGLHLRIFTMCSGTEAPVLAMTKLSAALRALGISFGIHHVASVEIEPIKQAFIEANSDPEVIFRDVVEFDKDNAEPQTVYGAKGKPPQNIDILVAGSSCVDYSGLNVQPKAFAIQGESYATMRGIAGYCKRFRPKLVILENVKSAPWQEIKGYWETIDYVGHAFIVDGKDFGTPQTRQRGYMFAIDTIAGDKFGFDYDNVFKQFESNLSDLQRRATAPYTAFTISMDELAYDEASHDLLTNGTGRKGARDWSVCKLRYDSTRVEKKLGFSRAVTFWQNNGISCPPDFFAMRSTLPRLGERVMESLDLYKPYFLVDRGYDVLYKARVPDVSQNADRELDTAHWGILRCITPHGMLFDFLRGGLLTGRELLVLQGLAAHELRLDIGNSKQLTDLAGNAMTGTAVGAIMAAAISVSYKVDKRGKQFRSLFDSTKNSFSPLTTKEEPRNTSKTPADVLRSWEVEYNMSRNPQALHIEGSCSKGELVEAAFKSRQLCLCEGYSVSKRDKFSICKDCGHTVCSACKGNPRHNYEFLTTPSRDIPETFIHFVEKRLPKSLTVDATHSVDFKLLLNSLQTLAVKKDCTEWITDAVESHYHYNAVKRSRNTTIEFLSASGRLELRLSPTSDASIILGHGPLKECMDCEWYLYVTCSKGEPAKSPLRDALEVPVARMKPDSSDILCGSWEVRKLDSPDTTVTIVGEGEPRPSYESSIQINEPRWKTRQEFTQLEIRFNDQRLPEMMKFRLISDCAAPHGSIYKSLVPCTQVGGKYVYILLDVQPLRPAIEDFYVLTTDPHRRNNFERRSYVVSLPPGWRMNVTAAGSMLSATQPCKFADSWLFAPNMTLRKNASESYADVWESSIGPISRDNMRECKDISSPSFGVVVPLTSELKQSFPAGTTFELDLVGRHGKFQPLEWLLSQLDIPYSEHGAWQELGTRAVGEGRCHCAPKKPKLSWYWTCTNGKSKRKIIKPFEEFGEAETFEKAQKLKPSKAKAVIHCYKQEVFVAVYLAPQTLVHEAAASISRDLNGPSAIVRWRAMRRAILTKRPSFQLQTLKKGKPADCSLVTCNNVRIESLLAGCYDHNLLPKRKLLDHQVLVVTWALHQEAGCTKWSEVEQRDVHIPPLRLSLEAQATIGKDIRGGVIADNVGAGKTISALALFAADVRLSGLQSRQEIKIDPETGRIPTAATLVVVPHNLVQQWREQAVASINADFSSIITLTSMKDVLNHKLEDFVGTKFIIISNNLFNQPNYWRCLRTLAYAPNVPFTGGRAFDQWLSLARANAAEMFKAQAQNPDDSHLTKFWAQRERAKQTLEKYESLPAFRNRKDYKATAAKKTIPPPSGIKEIETDPKFAPDALKDEAALDEAYWATLEMWPINGTDDATSNTPRMYALFHFFDFRRVVVDEFQYLKDLSLRAVMELSAERRWLLSATPPIHSLQGVNTMARLLGTKITNDEVRPEHLGASTRSVGMVHQQSRVEEFLNYKDGLSASTQLLQHQQAYRFLESFVRQNPVPLTTEEICRFVVYEPTPADLRAYYETLQAVLSESIVFGRCAKTPENETRPEFVKRKAQSSGNAIHALVRCTSLLREEKDFSLDVRQDSRNILTDHTNKFVEVASEFFKLSREAFALDSKVILIPPKKGSKKSTVEPKGINSEKDTNWRKFVRSLTDDDAFDDRTIALFLSHVLEVASKAPVVSTDLPNDYDFSQEKAEKKWNTLCGRRLSARTKVLKSLVDRLVKLAKVIRFFQAFLAIIADKSAICGSCHQHFPAQSLILLITCGHMVCKDCRKASSGGETCFEKSCRTLPNDRLMPSASVFGSATDGQEMGSRMHTVVNTIKQILAEKKESNEPENKILVFAQHKDVVDHLKAALKKRGVKCVDASEPSRQSVKTFLDQPEKGAKVLILKMNTEDAAGWNLQVINHVMFVTPLIVDSQHAYESIMRQAKGRALRYGNKHKAVTVWHFAMANTMDVNVLEDRLGKTLVLRGVTNRAAAIERHEFLETDVSLRGPGLLGEEIEGDENGGEDGGSGEGEGEGEGNGADANEAGA